MKKKIFAVALAAVMAISSAVCAFGETLTGTAWWTGTQVSQDTALSGDGTITFTIKNTAGDAAGAAAFNVELYEPGGESGKKHYITTGALQDAWYAEEATGDEIAIEKSDSVVEVGATYTVTVTRSGADVTFVYAKEDGTQFCKMTAANTNLGSDIAVHVIAQLGTFEVTSVVENASEAEAPAEDPTEAPAEGATTAAPAASANTGDATTVAGVAVVALAAAAAVVVLKKRTVTE